jgi:GntR family transcriptional regulator
VKKESKIILNIKVDVKSALPIYEQIKRAIKIAILSGKFKDGDKLTSIREMAIKLKINPNTIIKIYTQLETEGYVYSRPGLGYFIRRNKENLKKDRYEIFKQETFDYISKVSELGYSYNDILKIIENNF